MRTVIVLCVITLSAALAANWTTVGGNNEHNGLAFRACGPLWHEVLWEAQTLPATIAMQVYTWDTFAVTMRYNFSPMQGTLVCHNVNTGDTIWTRLYRPGGKFIPFAMGDGRVYVRNFKETGHDTIFCVDAATGDILWQSDWTGPLGIIWCGCLAENGDLITPCAENGIARLDKETGDTVWTNSRPIPNTGAEWIAMSDSVIYAWEGLGINRPKYLIAIDATDGHTLFKTPELPGDGDQEIPFVVGSGHVVYCQRDGGLFYAFRDIDTAFARLWTRSDLLTGTYSNYGVGPDSTLYVPSGQRIYRLNPESGATMDSSPVLASAAIDARISIDNYPGRLFAMVTTGSGEGKLWCLSPDLDSLWVESYPYGYYSGPAFAQAPWFNDVMIVAGAGTLLRCYWYPQAIAEAVARAPRASPLAASPNPFSGTTTIRFAPSRLITHHSSFAIFDASGRLVRVLSVPQPLAPNPYSLSWDGTDAAGRRLPAGTYFLRWGGKSLPLVLTE